VFVLEGLDLNLSFKKKTYFVAFLFSFFILHAQENRKADSLWNILNTKEITSKKKASILRDIAIYTPDLKKALQAAQQSLQISTKIQELILQAEALEEIGILERKLGNAILALSASLKALRIYEKLKLYNRLAASYDQVGINYVTNEDYDLAIINFKRAIKSYHSDSLNLLAIMNNLGETYREINELDSAEVYFKAALQKNNLLDIDYLHLKSYSLGNLGMVYTSKNNLKDAEFYLKDALTILHDFNDVYAMTTYMATLGSVYDKMGKHPVAEKQFNEALHIAQQSGLKEQIRDISKVLVEFYESQKEYEKALIHQKKFQIYQDSLVNRKNIKEGEQLKAGYEINKREDKISLLNQITSIQKRRVFFLVIGSLLLLLLIYVLFRSRKKVKNKNQQLSLQKEIISRREKEKALLLDELNHRVKNNLQMIASLLNLQSNQLTGHPAQEAIIIGRQRVEALSLVHRKLYQEGVDTRIHLKEYISELILGLFHSYDAGFDPELNISDVSVNVDIVIPLALIINEIIINALKYAYKGIKKPSLKINIYEKSTHTLHISIIDNGIGFDEDIIKNANSLGLKIINSLILQLNGTIKKIDANGTTWEIEVKK